MAYNGEREGCCYIIQWRIENFSYCWHKKGEQLLSPSVVIDSLAETEWSLSLYPKGYNNGNCISYFLCREKDSKGPDVMEINYELSFLGEDGSVLKTRGARSRPFRRDSWGYVAFQKREIIFDTERDAYLPKDTLTVQCKIWNSGEKIVENQQFIMRTIVRVDWRSFIWPIKRFSSLQSDEKIPLVVKTTSKDISMTLELFYRGGQFSDEILNMAIHSFDPNVKLFTFQTMLLDFKRNSVDCGKQEFWFNDLNKGVIFALPLSKKFLLKNKTNYLPNDVLNLNCKYAFSTGIAFEGIEKIFFGVSIGEIVDNACQTVTDNSQYESSCFLKDDLKFLYSEGILSDMQLRTADETFPVHTVILSARSAVFRRMFSTDMQENAEKYVYIPDLDNDTVRRMLMFVYTDAFQSIQWENAVQLYAAADKYELLSLKSKCSCLLKTSFCSTNACQILILADMHQDVCLKKEAQEYILRHSKSVFSSNEWAILLDTYPKLAAETMGLKFSEE
ncbi:TD and POZ domain-containing protein 5 [Araneus ventricosus]|uniref:TD and POZ domain-containing protein 5 n=1 Tax=Araneus ventricosus TaxID=182803 RepID=A0A4Y2DN94_ARAVE|nr:TD and POZ domain-containing protein 5 [Araneus ventricosus]